MGAEKVVAQRLALGKTREGTRPKWRTGHCHGIQKRNLRIEKRRSIAHTDGRAQLPIWPKRELSSSVVEINEVDIQPLGLRRETEVVIGVLAIDENRVAAAGGQRTVAESEFAKAIGEAITEFNARAGGHVEGVTGNP